MGGREGWEGGVAECLREGQDIELQECRVRLTTSSSAHCDERDQELLSTSGLEKHSGRRSCSARELGVRGRVWISYCLTACESPLHVHEAGWDDQCELLTPRALHEHALARLHARGLET